MVYNYNEDYQYDSCVSQGICSVNPRTSSLQEVLVLYLKLTAYYALKLSQKGQPDINAKNIILYTISIIVSNFEFSERDFKLIVNGFNKILPELIEKYKSLCEQDGETPQMLETNLNFNREADIIKSIQLGEKEFLKKTKALSEEIRDLYKILFVLAKSICINVLDLESFGIDAEEGYFSILALLNSLNAEQKDTEKIKASVKETAKKDNCLMKMLYDARIERYGEPKVSEVSYTTVPGKAILVVGSNIRELEDVLEAVKDKKIDVYTHDEMILANTFPKFSEYKNLKGQYGQGMENCLLDFATFPGPIILTRHSLYNVEHLYRGLLFTTDFANSRGIIQIKDNDFTEVIKSAEDAKGFKTGRRRETISIGCDYEDVIGQVKEQVGKYKRIFLIGPGAYTLEQKAYFEKLLTQVPDDVLVISLSYCIKRNNVICLNACFDSYAVTRFSERLTEETDLPAAVFFPMCSRHTISQMIYLAENEKLSVYTGKCTPILLNPNTIVTFQKVFNINGLTCVKKDLAKILE